MSKVFFFNAEEFRKFRVVNRLSQEALGQLIGVTKAAVNRIELSLSEPSPDTLANIMYLYSIDGNVEFDRVFNSLPFGGPDPKKFILPELGSRRPSS